MTAHENDHMSLADIRGAIRTEEITSFSQIPLRYHTRDVAIEMLHASDRTLKDIPFRLVDDDMRRTAINLYACNIRDIRPNETDRYDELLFQAMKAKYCSFRDIAVERVTPSMLASACTTNEQIVAEVIGRRAWKSQEERHSFIQEMVELNSRTLSHVDLSEVDDKTIARSVMNTGFPFGIADKLAQNGRHEVFSIIAKGKGLIGWMERPKGILQGIKALVWSSSTEERHILTAYVRSFPIERVCKAILKTPELSNVLVTLYTAEELLPHIQHSAQAKAALAREDFGL